jgi:TPR repeat protein
MKESLPVLLLLAGCSYSTGFIREASTTHSFSYAMPISGQAYLKSARGSASEDKVLCFINTSAGQVYARAMDELLSMAALKPNQILASVREDRDHFLFPPFFCSVTLTLSADVIEITPTVGMPSAPKETRATALAPTPDPGGPSAAAAEEECAKGDAATCLGLGRDFLSGQGVKQEEGEALSLFLKACDKRSGEGCARAASLLHKTKLDSQAAELDKKACSLGFAASCPR